ncbi:MAG: 6-pyruvoyl trahydropterin synthase family protein [Planctomycetota bacterium]|jgi:6-pyruvoyltetrahydropterin/6-carboxytetrahydropterin synthase
MYTAAKVLRFCYGHRLVGHTGACRHLHGHNARVEVICAKPELDALGMVVDFSDIHDALRSWIDENWDHRMILASDDPVAEILKAQGEPVFLLDGPPTAERLAAHLFGIAEDAGLPVERIRLWETETSVASYGKA